MKENRFSRAPFWLCNTLPNPWWNTRSAVRLSIWQASLEKSAILVRNKQHTRTQNRCNSLITNNTLKIPKAKRITRLAKPASRQWRVSPPRNSVSSTFALMQFCPASLNHRWAIRYRTNWSSSLPTAAPWNASDSQRRSPKWLRSWHVTKAPS